MITDPETDPIPTRQEFLRYLWQDLINSHLRDDGADIIIANCQRNPEAPFADTGAVLERMLAAGVSRSDINLFARATAYETVFGLLYALDDPGVEGDNVFMLYEELLAADPTGMEGRPGSAERARLLDR